MLTWNIMDLERRDKKKACLSEGLGRGRRGLLIFLAFLSGTTGYF
jgi:hypothetical protein